MMTFLDIEPHVDADICWHRDLWHVMNYGFKSQPRNMEVLECLGYASVISMRNPIIKNSRRGLGYKFMAAEAAWILSGKNDVASIAPFSKEISKFSDDGLNFFGAYGPPINDQFQYVVSCLDQDPDSRQAVLTIWRQNPPQTKDVPCTVSLQFLVRHNMLYCVANMRSSDLWLGHPYDIFNFSMVSYALLLELNIRRGEKHLMPLVLGELFLFCGSKHIYSRNWDAVSEMIDLEVEQIERPVIFNPDKFADALDLIQALWDAANSDKGALTFWEE